MKKEISVYENQDFSISAVLDEKQAPWFIVSDVCQILDLNNISRALDGLEEDWKCRFTISNPAYTPHNKQNKKTTPWFVSEPGLYALIFKSRKEEAKKFRRWVFEDVLPEIRKTGSYNTTRGLVKIDYKRLASDIFQTSGTDERAKKTLGVVINMVNKAITGMSSFECKEKYNLSPRDWIMKNNSSKIEEYDRVQKFIVEEIERGRYPAQIKDTLKTMGYKI